MASCIANRDEWKLRAPGGHDVSPHARQCGLWQWRTMRDQRHWGTWWWSRQPRCMHAHQLRSSNSQFITSSHLITKRINCSESGVSRQRALWYTSKPTNIQTSYYETGQILRSLSILYSFVKTGKRDYLTDCQERMGLFWSWHYSHDSIFVFNAKCKLLAAITPNRARPAYRKNQP
jgi:hypothetical protein